MDLVSCRNLLIYMDAELQAAVIPAFHYSLLPEQRTALEASLLRADDRSIPSNASTPIASTFEGKEPSASLPSRVEENTPLLSPAPDELEQVKQELLRWQEQFQALTELHQTALEELRSSNEELQSVSDEMHTVNLQLSEKVGELDQSNSDLRNLFESTEIATIFRDRHLIIRSFTHAVGALYNLIPSDVGRPLTDILSRLDYARLSKDIAHVLETLQPFERRISRADRSMHYITRI